MHPYPSIYTNGLLDLGSAYWWSMAMASEVAVVGWIVVWLALAIDRYTTAHGWAKTRRLLPGIIVALLLLGFSAAETQTHLMRAIFVDPYCNDYWYYLNWMCWI